jgi:CelD/BcsL family acetyltransferase involved in cellulose biosynthesis
VPASLWEYLAQNKNKWDIIEFNEFTFGGFEHQILKGQSQAAQFLWREEKNDHYFITLQDTWEKFSERLGRKFRYNLRRALRLAEEIGPVEIRHFSGEQVTWEVFQTVIEINRHANHPRLYSSQTEQALIRELTEQTSPKQGWLDVYILSVNNEAIAYEYGFAYEGRFEDWRSGFDTRFPANVSVGKLLAMQVVQKCIQEKYNEIDFLRGDESYKQEWMPLHREFVNMRIFNKKSIPAVIAYLWLEKVKPLFKKQPAPDGQDQKEDREVEKEPSG